MKKKSKTPHYDTRDYDPDANKEKIMELEPCVKFVTEAWDEWDSHWGDKMNKFEEYYKRWKDNPPKRGEDWQSQFQKRLSWQAISTLVARYYSMLFPVSAPIEAEATETQDEVYRILAKSIVAHWFKLGKIARQFLAGIRSAGVYGTGLFEDDWFVKTGKVAEKVEKDIPDFRAMVDGMGNKVLDEQGNIRSEQVGFRKILTEEKKNKVIEDRYRLRKTSIFAWRIHPDKKSDDDDYPVIKQEFVTFADLQKMERNAQRFGLSKFENMDLLEKDKSTVEKKDKDRIDTDNGFVDKKNPSIYLQHYYGLYADKEGEEKKPTWILVANRKYKLFKKDNPFWHQKPPLFHIVWTEDEKESYYGIGVCEIGGDAEDRANTTVNIRIDERKKNIRQGGWYNSNDKKIKKTDLKKNIPGLWKPCGDVTNIKPDMPLPKSTMDDYKEEEVSVNDHREITMATTSMTPTADVKQQHNTLGGMELLASQGLQRLKPDLSMMEMQGIRVIANRAFLMTRQFMTLPQTVELVASEDKLKEFNLQKIYQMRPDQLMGGVNFFCTGLSESVDKMHNIDKALKFMEILQKTTPGNPFIMYLTKKIALWLGFEDAEQYVQQMNTMMPQQGMQGQPGMPQQPGMPPQQPQMPMPPPQPPMPPPPPGGGQIPPQVLAMLMQARQGQQQPNQGGMV